MPGKGTALSHGAEAAPRARLSELDGVGDWLQICFLSAGGRVGERHSQHRERRGEATPTLAILPLTGLHAPRRQPSTWSAPGGAPHAWQRVA